MFSVHCSHCAVVVIAKLGVKISSDVICFCLDTIALGIIAFVYWNRAQEIALYTATGRHASQETPLQYIYKRVQSNCIFPDLNWFYHSKHVSAVVLNFFGFFVAGTIPTLTFSFHYRLWGPSGNCTKKFPSEGRYIQDRFHSKTLTNYFNTEACLKLSLHA